ncbi:DUF4129 domain-containing protein [Tissierella sp.]|uniref:DUF4129 domain-containing protein n=1 Tax=Tissierella sp. TaxID=41274 RepID=UPI0028574596|nr:DUF4129 domain-containing protein [Tissierella sp.]MDR7857410.1 DUF4129 domain-containing protein [Tissierella sp.]
MLDLILLELISLISFIYSLVLMYVAFVPINEMILIFLWTLFVSTTFALSYKKSIFFEGIILLLFLPLKFYNSNAAIFLIVFTAFMLYLYIKKSLLSVNYDQYLYKLKISYTVLVLTIAMRSLLLDFSGSIGYALFFIIMYLLSSILLNRLMRHLDANMDIKKIRKTNFVYLGFMSVGFVISTFEKLRGNIVDVIDKIITAIYYPIYLLLRNFDLSSESNKKTALDYAQEETTKTISEISPEEIENMMNSGIFKLFKVFSKIMLVVLILLLAYIIYKLFTRNGDSTIDYTEERENIKDLKKKKRRIRREKYPSERKEQIRYYYRRYLEKLKKINIELLKSDTSLEVNEKAGEVLEGDIDELREIYIESRYGDKEVDSPTVEKMEKLYKKL